MAIRQEGNTYYGLSTDTKPTGAVLNGREFREMDTGKKYLFDAENGEWLEQPEEGGGGGGGSSTLSGLTDVDISNPTDGQTLIYNATSGKWENGAGGGGGADAIIRENRDESAGTTSYVLYSGSYNDLLTKLQARQPVKVALERSIDYGNDEFDLEAMEAASASVGYYEGSYHEISLFFVFQNYSGGYPNQGNLYILPNGTVTDRLD